MAQDDPARDEVPAGMFARLTNDFTSSLRMGIIGWTVAALIAAGVGWFGLQGGKLLDLWRDRQAVAENLPSAEALRLARKTINGTVLWVAPFRNRGDNTQYIAAWVRDTEQRCADNLPEPQATACYDNNGWVHVYVMAGNDGVYEARKTPLKAMAQYLDYDAETPASMQTAEFRIGRLPYFGVTDWNSDGNKEILSTSQTSGTQPTHRYVTGLFDVAANSIATLDVAQSQTSDSFAFSGAASQALKNWLGQRHREFIAASDSSRECTRSLQGALVCDTKATSPQAAVDAGADSGQDFGDLEGRLIDRWSERNGVGFTTGKIDLALERGPEIKAYGTACARAGRWTLFNIFKGPLVIVDPKTRAASVLYQQDGDHHREMPIVVVGRDYIWLGLSTGRGIIAISRRDFTAIEAWVDEWRNGVPDVDPYGDPGKPLQLQGRKDLQLDGLSFKSGRLLYGGKPLDLRIDGPPIDQATEFRNASGCTSGGESF